MLHKDVEIERPAPLCAPGLARRHSGRGACAALATRRVLRRRVKADEQVGELLAELGLYVALVNK